MAIPKIINSTRNKTKFNKDNALATLKNLNDTIDEINNQPTGPNYLNYLAYIKQAGLLAPNAVTINNEATLVKDTPIIDTIGGTWNYISTGTFHYVKVGAFANAEKVTVALNPVIIPDSLILATVIDADTIKIESLLSGSLGNNVLQAQLIDIKIYN